MPCRGIAIDYLEISASCCAQAEMIKLYKIHSQPEEALHHTANVTLIILFRRG